jgi:hypothetical protein
VIFLFKIITHILDLLNIYYIIKHKREYSFKYRKDVLVKQGFNKNKSEREIMKERGINRIYMIVVIRNGYLNYKN